MLTAELLEQGEIGNVKCYCCQGFSAIMRIVISDANNQNASKYPTCDLCSLQFMKSMNLVKKYIKREKN